jgi:hypothetical protein
MVTEEAHSTITGMSSQNIPGAWGEPSGLCKTGITEKIRRLDDASENDIRVDLMGRAKLPLVHRARVLTLTVTTSGSKYTAMRHSR